MNALTASDLLVVVAFVIVGGVCLGRILHEVVEHRRHKTARVLARH